MNYSYSASNVTTFDVPGIAHTSGTPNASERVVADNLGAFEVVISECHPVGAPFPEVSAMLSRYNGANVERVLWDRVGLMVEVDGTEDACRRLVWRNRPTGPHGFLLRRGSYLFQARVDGRPLPDVWVVSNSSPEREDWKDYVWTNACVLIAPTAPCELAGA